MSTSPDLTNASLSSATSLVALQFLSRLFTFALNQALFRLASPKAYGTAAIQFELLLSTILFLSREGVRNALLRTWSCNSDAPGGMAIQNTSYIPIAIGFPLAIVTSSGYGYFAGYETRSQPYFKTAIGIYALAAMVELLSEPMHNRAMAELKTNVRVRAEGLGITSKTVVTLLVLLFDSQGESGSYALVAFAVGQFAYSAAVASYYLAHYGNIFILQRMFNDGFDLQTVRLSLTMTSQSLVKHFLTEGDKFVLSWLSPLQDQGGYAIAVNYGSLIARILFQPIEETSRVFFSKLLLGNSEKDRSSLKQASEALFGLLSVQTSFTILLITFGTTYMPIVLHMLLPPQYFHTSAPQVLSAWVWYIPALAINGGLEAFLASVATERDLHRQSRWMIIFSVIYVAASLTFYSFHFGDVSLVYANIINLSARILYAASFVSSYFESRSSGDFLRWKDITPGLLFVASSLGSYFLVKLSESTLAVWDILEARGRGAFLTVPILLHISLGGGLAILCVVAWWWSSGRFLVYPGRGLKQE